MDQGAAAAAPVRFIVPGRPFPKARPRFSNKRVYPDAKTQVAEDAVLWAFRGAHQRKIGGGVPIGITAEFRFAYTTDHYLRGELREDVPEWFVGRPDVDNLMKLITDALATWAFDDDAQIVRMDGTKPYALEAETVVAIYPV